MTQKPTPEPDCRGQVAHVAETNWEVTAAECRTCRRYLRESRNEAPKETPCPRRLGIRGGTGSRAPT